MNINVIIQNTNTGKIYDISNITGSIKIDSKMEGAPDKISFKVINPTRFDYISEGSIVRIKVNDIPFFFGFIFDIEEDESFEVSVNGYCQMRYLKAKDTYVFSDMTASEIFSKICTDFEINHSIINPSTHKLPERVNDNKTLADIIQYGLDKTLIDTGNWYIMRDNFGTLEFLDVKTQELDLIIGDASLLTSYKYKSTIDSDTYNQIKLIKENKEEKVRELYIVKDSDNIKRWGLLQFSEKVDENMNEAQIEERADMLLKYYNKAKKTLKLDCIGDLRVRGGCGVILAIADIKNKVAYKKPVLVTSVTHQFKAGLHTMSLEVRVM